MVQNNKMRDMGIGFVIGCLTVCAIVGIYLAYLFFVLNIGNVSVKEKSMPVEETSSVAETTPGAALEDWQILLLAVAMTESEFRPDAEGTAQDWGILQLTPIYIAEANRVCGTPDRFVHEDAWDVRRSLEIFETVQAYRNPGRDIDVAIRLHNAAPWYGRRVKANMGFVRRYEALRRELGTVSRFIE